jgi:hypothetical protein
MERSPAAANSDTDVPLEQQREGDGYHDRNSPDLIADGTGSTSSGALSPWALPSATEGDM